MVERGVINLTPDPSDHKVQNKRGNFYLQKNLYAVCCLNLSLLPIRLNLPMVCPPLDWASARPEKPARTISDLVGGYLTSPSGAIYDRYRLLSTGDLNHFYISIGRYDNYKKLCSIMNKLQGQPFKINSDFLKYLRDNEHLLVKHGYLMPKILATLNS